MDSQPTDERSNKDIFNEVGRQGDLLFNIMLDNQREQRGGMALLDSRTTAVEVDVARLSSAITNLLENLSNLTQTFAAHSAANAEVLVRLKRIEEKPALSTAEIARLQQDNQDRDNHKANREKASLDLRVGLIVAAFGLLCTIIATLATLYFTGAIHL